MIDWPATLVRAKDRAGEWILAGSHVPASSLSTVKRLSNHALRALEHPIEGKILEKVGTPARGDLYVRYLGPREAAPNSVPFFRTVVVSPLLKERVTERALSLDTTVTALVEEACGRIAKRGLPGFVTGQSTTLNVSPDAEIWQAALARAQADGFVLADAIRAELGRLG